MVQCGVRLAAAAVVTCHGARQQLAGLACVAVPAQALAVDAETSILMQQRAYPLAHSVAVVRAQLDVACVTRPSTVAVATLVSWAAYAVFVSRFVKFFSCAVVVLIITIIMYIYIYMYITLLRYYYY